MFSPDTMAHCVNFLILALEKAILSYKKMIFFFNFSINNIYCRYSFEAPLQVALIITHNICFYRKKKKEITLLSRTFHFTNIYGK